MLSQQLLSEQQDLLLEKLCDVCHKSGILWQLWESQFKIMSTKPKFIFQQVHGSQCSFQASAGTFPRAQQTGNTHHVEIQAVDPDTGIVFNAQIDVFLDPKAKVPRV